MKCNVTAGSSEGGHHEHHSRQVAGELLEKDLRLDKALQRTLRGRWRNYCKRLRQCQHHLTEKAVHELRVATRRLMAEMFLLEACLDSKSATRVRQVLKKRRKELGDMRDNHIQAQLVARNLATFPELAWVKRQVEKRERKLEQAARKKVKRFGNRKLQAWTEIISHDLKELGATRNGRQKLIAAALMAAGAAFEKVVARRESVLRADLQTIHQTRIAFKRFRYIVELLSPDVTGFDRKRLGMLASYQRRMGNLQDLHVLQQWLGELVAKHPGKATALEPFRLELCQREDRLLNAFLDSADDLYQFWPPPGQGSLSPFRKRDRSCNHSTPTASYRGEMKVAGLATKQKRGTR